MLWLLILHIGAILCWCGSLLYLPALITDAVSQPKIIEQQRRIAVTRMIYRLIVTPAALIAIASGTAIFLINGITAHWLILKLTLVSALVLCHALIGWIILYKLEASRKIITLSCALLGSGTAVLIPAIVWLVLTKPI